MEWLKQHVKDNYHLSSYQIAQISFLFKTLFSEVSKILIMGIAFRDQLSLYFFALFVMILLRSCMGGLHFYTYPGCLAVSVLYLWLAVYMLPLFPVTIYIKLILLLLCALTGNLIGPVISKYRPESCRKHFTQCRQFSTIFILFYALILYIMPETSQYLSVGFWVIILHSLQLIAAKIRMRGGDFIK